MTGENLPALLENWPVLLMMAYLLWDWANNQRPSPEVAEMKKKLDEALEGVATSREEMDALLSEQEEVNAGFHRWLLQTDHPDGVALREKIEMLQGRICRLRLDLGTPAP